MQIPLLKRMRNVKNVFAKIYFFVNILKKFYQKINICHFFTKMAKKRLTIFLSLV